MCGTLLQQPEQMGAVGELGHVDKVEFVVKEFKCIPSVILLPGCTKFGLGHREAEAVQCAGSVWEKSPPAWI